MGEYILWESTSYGRVHPVGEYILWESTSCGRVHAENVNVLSSLNKLSLL